MTAFVVVTYGNVKTIANVNIEYGLCRIEVILTDSLTAELEARL